MSMTLPLTLAKQYLSKVFVETGTNLGGAVALALEAGYETVYSVELNSQFYESARQRFADNPAVHLFHGSSVLLLPEILSKLDGKATLWLDAHENPPGPSPLTEELDQIKKCNVDYHTIMIDDRI